MAKGQSIGSDGTNCGGSTVQTGVPLPVDPWSAGSLNRLGISSSIARRSILFFGAVALILVISIPAANAATHIATQNYTSNVTWTAANSPYIIDGNVTVKPGATLTVEPGVIVKFNGISRWLTIEGTLNATGNKDNRIVFTSLKDDSVGGDDGNDGATTGSPGDWAWLLVKGIATLRWTDVRYGGYGSSDTAYGAINVQGGQATIDRTRITDSQRSGIIASLNGSVTLSRSLLGRNHLGAYVSNSTLNVSDGSEISQNNMGLWFNLLSTFTGARSTVMDSNIRWNTGYGVYLPVPASLAASLWPAGNRNNIYGNATTQQFGTQLYSQSSKRQVDWKGNFWGSFVHFRTNVPGCASTGLNAAGYIAYSASTTVPPAGPIPRTVYPSGNYVCYADVFDIGPTDFTTFYINHDYGVDGPPEDYYRMLPQRAPVLKYDSGGQFYAISPGALTDFYAGDGSSSDGSNSLKDAQGMFAIADPAVWDDLGLQVDRLRLLYLGSTYTTNEPNPSWRAGTGAMGTDFLSARGNADDNFYQGDASTMGSRPGYANKVYGHVTTGSDGKLWLQYWIFYYFNPPTGPWGAHEGDWEMIQVGLKRDFTAEDAVYAQHATQQKCDWASVERTTEDRPIVYVGINSHASYFGSSRIPAPYNSSDRADGFGGVGDPGIEEVRDDSPTWVQWPGHWGDSDSNSPPGPRFQPNGVWGDPSNWAVNAWPC